MTTKRKNITIFVTITVIGSVLGWIGTISFPVDSNMSYFWPAAVIQALGGVLFGWVGVLAATIFPSVSNALTDGSLTHVIGLVPINFIQSYLPYLVKRTTKFSSIPFNKKTLICFVVGCAIVPNVIGGVIGCWILYKFHNITTLGEYWNVLKVWLTGNISCSVIFGIILLKTIAPVLKDCGLLVDENDE